MTDAHFKPGRALFPDVEDKELKVMPVLENDESSFDEDYEPKPILEDDSPIRASWVYTTRIDGEPGSGFGRTHRSQDKMDDNIAARAWHHEQRKAMETRGETLQAAARRAET